MESCVPIANCVSSDEILSSLHSSEDCNSRSRSDLNQRSNKNKRPSKGGCVIDKKIFLKFNKLTKTLKETRTNLLSVDQMLGKFKANNKQKEHQQGTRPRGRRTASVPPPLSISNCHWCSGDNSIHQLKCQSMNNLNAEMPRIDKPSFRHSQSMQDLRIVPSPIFTSKEPLLQAKLDDAPCGEPMNSARESDVSMTSIDDMRSDILSLKTQLKKLELTSHFQSKNDLLFQQMEMKDRIIVDMTQHLQELSRKLEISEDQRCQLLLRLEDTLRTSLDVGSEAERFAAEVKRMEEVVSEVQKDKDRLRKRARKIMLELKEKCKHYLSDAQKLRDHEQEIEQKLNRTVLDNKSLTSQLANAKEQLQSVSAENQVMKVRIEELQTNFDEKDIEISELKATVKLAQQNIQIHKTENHKLLAVNDGMKSKIEMLQKEKTHTDIKMVAMDKELSLSLQRLEELKNEIKTLRMSNSDCQAKLLAESSLRQAIEHAGQEMTEKVNNLETQLSTLQNKYLDVINEHGKRDEEQKHQELMKGLQLQYESRFTNLKVELAENQATIHALEEALKMEKESRAQVKSELKKAQEDHLGCHEKYCQIQKAYQIKKKKLQEKNNHIKFLQENFFEVQQMAKFLEDDFKDILFLIYNDVEATVTLLASGSNNPPPVNIEVSIKKPKKLPSRDWLSRIKCQLRWIQEEIAHLPSINSTIQHRTKSADSVHIRVPLLSPKLDRSPLKQFSPICLEEKVNAIATVPVAPGETKVSSSPLVDDSRSIAYPLNSTELPESQKTNWDSTESEIIKRYQRFQQIFENINADFTKSNIQFEPEPTVEAAKVGVSGGGLLSSSLSSISEFSCEGSATPVVEEVTDLTNVAKASEEKAT